MSNLVQLIVVLHHEGLTPAHYTQPIDHGGVAVSAHYTVRVEQALYVEHHSTQVFKVHLRREGGREGERGREGGKGGKREGGREGGSERKEDGRREGGGRREGDGGRGWRNISHFITMCLQDTRLPTWCTMPEPGGTMSMFRNAFAPHLRNWKRSLFRWNSSSWFRSRASVLLGKKVGGEGRGGEGRGGEGERGRLYGYQLPERLH